MCITDFGLSLLVCAKSKSVLHLFFWPAIWIQDRSNLQCCQSSLKWVLRGFCCSESPESPLDCWHFSFHSLLFISFHFFFFLLHWESMKKETWQSISENKIKKTNEGLHADLHIRYRFNLIMISPGHYLKEEHYSKLILLHHLWSCPLRWATPGSSIFWAQTLKERDHLPWASAAEFSSSQIWTQELRNRPFEQWVGTITQGKKWGERILLPVVTLCILQPLQHIGDGRCGGRSRRHRRRIQAVFVLLVELEGCRYLVTDGIFDRLKRRSK